MPVGSVQVDFAGTYEEAVQYAKENGVNAPKGLSHHGADAGLPMLSLPYKNSEQRIAAQAKFHSLGWDEGSQMLIVYGQKGAKQ